VLCESPRCGNPHRYILRRSATDPNSEGAVLIGETDSRNRTNGAAKFPSRMRRAKARPVSCAPVIYGAVLLWAFSSVVPHLLDGHNNPSRTAVDVTQGHWFPGCAFQPDWKGWPFFPSALSPEQASANLRRPVQNSMAQRLRPNSSHSVGFGAVAFFAIFVHRVSSGVTALRPLSKYKFGPFAKITTHRFSLSVAN